MTKKYGTTELSSYSENLKKDQAERRSKLKKLFSQPLFPKGTGGLFPKYDKALEKKKLASIDDAMIVKPAKPKNPEQASNNLEKQLEDLLKINLKHFLKHSKKLKVKRLLPSKVSHMLELLRMN